MTGLVRWHITMSLDGFITGPGESMDFVSGHADRMPASAREVVRTTGALLAGRNWYDVAMERYNGLDGVYGGAWRGPVFVMTHRSAPEAADPSITFLAGAIETGLAAAREAADGRDVVVFGADVARQCLKAGLLDEILVHLAPVLLGDGVRLVSDPTLRVDLERTELGETGGLTDLRFRVLK
ncbi:MULTISPECIES: dihydrofolate reductase family protein [unclassified Actinomadura]|uniref:dihydrofolate reductase family protein n=1 Tax=unclassified Actinomadura TaxID=2626254 RepID=UPI0011EEF2EB|nr:dihydrofolate reductase family protein [Actinomadura sp. K4S16]